jgi:predicted ATP-dependent endonuclease of OLD family
MLLTRLLVSQLGPFREQLDLQIDPRVTVLTGANDAGKTSVLRALWLFFGHEIATEKDVNRDHRIAVPHSWRKDNGASISAYFKFTSSADIAVSGITLGKEDYGIVSRNPTPETNHLRFQVFNNGSQGTAKFPLPTCIQVGLQADALEIRSIIPLDKPNPLESALLNLAFNGPFSIEKYSALSPGAWEDSVANAQDLLNKQLRFVVPNSDHFEFRVRSSGDKFGNLAVSIRDAQSAITPFEYRGNGARKMVQILVRLLVEGKGGAHRVILIDEPENSLHADAQHLLREFLFDLTADGKTQVILTTHSPCMLNPMRPQSVRLLERAKTGEQATTILRKRPEELGFRAIRSSWGVTAADSLFFAPVVVIVEGPTETHCLPILCEKLATAGIAGFEDYEKILGLITVLDGEGQTLSTVAKIVACLGARVVVFVDGDKSTAVVQKIFNEKHPKIPVIRLPEGTEFEELVPQGRYFEALSKQIEFPESVKFQTDYEEWSKRHPETNEFLFTKKIKRWLEETSTYSYLKPEVMRRAAELTEPKNINAKPLRALLAAIREQLADTSFLR